MFGWKSWYNICMKLTRYTSEEVEEWAALYVDGKLDTVGDSYLIDDRIIELTGVDDREGNFLLGGNTRDDCAQTIDQIEVYEAERDIQIAKAARLREEAEKLIEEAKRLENS